MGQGPVSHRFVPPMSSGRSESTHALGHGSPFANAPRPPPHVVRPPRPPPKAQFSGRTGASPVVAEGLNRRVTAHRSGPRAHTRTFPNGTTKKNRCRPDSLRSNSGAAALKWARKARKQKLRTKPGTTAGA